MDEKRVSDYFVVAGLPETGERQPFEDCFTSRDGSTSPPALFNSSPSLDPITDITVIIRSAGEQVPPSWYCIETTPSGYPADLNHGAIRSPNIFLCYQRGRHKPPLVDIGVLYEGKERVMSDSEVVHTTLLGRSANVNNSSSRIFLTYRRAKENAPCNQLVVTDICVILMSKGETPPHAYQLIRKNLNKGMTRVNSSDVFICYKKSMNRPPLLRYQPCILGRFPAENYPGYELPHSVPLFCMPMGATIECWSKKCQQSRPVFSTFVLTSDAAVKVYGAAISFYEVFDSSKLNQNEKDNLEYDSPDTKQLYAMKSLCILSRWPFFDTFEKFLNFLYKTSLQSRIEPINIPLEQFISHFMMEIPFPSSQRPNVAYQLSYTSNEELKLSQPPEDMPLPLSGASFSQMLRNLGPEHCLNVLVLALAEQKILLHSLRPDVLTSVAESITSIIFPFVWQCPYIPLCPLGLCDVLNAPLPFIVGVDSRYFDCFIPPPDVACVDLDTTSIYLSELKKTLNSKLLPKKPARVLRATLEKLYEKLSRPVAIVNGNNSYSSSTSSSCKSPTTLSSEQVKKFERQIDLEIQEAFLRFMSSILKDFRSFLRPITKAPTVGATDPSSLFDIEGFLRSRDRSHQQLYNILMRTQMFARFIEERSFVSDKDSCLAFFDECLDKIENCPDFEYSNIEQLIDVDYIKSDRTVFIPPPEPLGTGETFVYNTIGQLNPDLFHAVPMMNHRSSCLSWQNLEAISPTRSSRPSLKPQSPLSRRTKQEVRIAQKIARRHRESPISWAKCLVSYVYSLWFAQLPAYIRKLESLPSITAQSKGTSLRLALAILSRLQSLNLHPVDETCYRVLMLLCGEYHQPVLAVKVLFEMRRNGVTPNAITYGYYNKAVLESPWPAGETTATILWSKLRNVIVGVSAFKKCANKNQPGCKKTLTFNEIEECEESDCTGGNGFTESNENTSTSGSLFDVDAPRVEHSKLLFYEEKKQNSTQRTGNNDRKMNENETQYPIDFSDSNRFRKRTGRVVRASTVALPYSLDYSSPAGLLISSSFNDDVFASPTKVPLKKRGRTRIGGENCGSASNGGPAATPTGYYEASPPDTLRKEFLRSYSFGNDSRIIQNLKEGTLKALKHELERNHQIVPENELCPDPERDEANKENCASVLGDQLSGQDGKSINEPNDTPPSSKGSSKQNLSVSSSLRKFSAHAIKTYRSSSVDGWLKDRKNAAAGSTGSMSPIKDAMSNLFSPEGKLASLANKLATKISETSAKDIIGRSLGESMDTPSSSSREQILKGSTNNQNRPESGMSRSATLPPDVEGRVALDCSNDVEPMQASSQENMDNDQGDLNQSTQSTSEKHKISSSSPWTKSLQGKHVDYLNSTLKSAANSMASRISEIRTNLSVNSPAKLSTPGGSFFSQWASIVEKLPTNLLADDDSSSINSSERRMSEDDISEGGTSRHPRLSSAIQSLIENIESHYYERLGESSLDAVIIIEMTSCCRCYQCEAFAFDEEIMSNWTADESNLNTQCEYCQSKFVPLLTIEVKAASLLTSPANGDSSKGQGSNDRRDGDHGDGSEDDDHSEDLKNTDKSKASEPFTVPYLSPLVLRKEVENVLEHESDACLLASNFIDDHPIIYWNLIWYFERVNLPSHLPGLTLQCNSILPQVTILPEHDHRNVKVVCRYDNERLHQDSSNIRPLYKRWLELAHPESSLLQSLVTDQRQVSLSVLKQILRYIQADDFKSAIHLLLTEKLKINCVKTPYSPYRELLFLSFVVFGRENIDQMNFHFSYKRAYESICHVGLSPCDQPPSFGAIFCRRFFKQLELQTLVKQSATTSPTAVTTAFTSATAPSGATESSKSDLL